MSAAAAAAVVPAGDHRLRRSSELADAVAAVEAVPDPVPEHLATVRRFLAEHPDALHRRCAAGHLTGSALVLDVAARRLVVLLHAKLGRWLQPGGHADGDANLAAVALREAGEETGIAGLRVALTPVDLDVHRVEPPGESAHLHLDVRYLVLAPPGAQLHGNHESRALRWVAPSELAGLGADEGLVRLTARALALAGELGGA